MSNVRFDNINDYRDVQTLNAYKREKNMGGDLNKFMKLKAFESRDNGRTLTLFKLFSESSGITKRTPGICVLEIYIVR